MRGRIALLPAAAALIFAQLGGCGSSEEYEKALSDGKSLFEARSYAEAEARFAEALTYESDSVEAAFYHARSLSRLRRFSDAFSKYKALSESGDFPSFETGKKAHVFREMGALLLRQAVDKNETSFYFRSLKAFTDSLVAEPESYESTFGRAVSLFGLDKFYAPEAEKDSAYHHFKKCASLMPSKPEALYYFALCHEMDRRLSSIDAIRIYREGLALYGDFSSMKPGAAPKAEVFETSIEGLDCDYLPRILRRLMPLVVKAGPEKLGTTAVELRKTARSYFDAYVRLGGKEKMPDEAMAWMEGAEIQPGPGKTDGSSTPPSFRGGGIRPVIAVLAPAGRTLRTANPKLEMEAAVTDDMKGCTIRVFVNKVEVHPRFDLSFFENEPFGDGKGVKTVAKFTVDLAEGDNAFVLKASDSEGLQSDEASFTASYKPASVYVIAAADPGPGGAAALAIDDARRFMAFAAGALAIPEENRFLLARAGLSARDLTAAFEKVEPRLFDQDVLVFYFAGTGACVMDASGPVLGLALSDFKGSSAHGFFPLSYVGGALARTKVRRLAVLLDASFAGAAGSGLRTAPGSAAGGEKALAEAPASILGASKKDEDRLLLLCASDGKGGAAELKSNNPLFGQGGLFTTVFLKAMEEKKADQDGDGKITVAELRPFLLDNVSYFSARAGRVQVPVVLGKPQDRPFN